MDIPISEEMNEDSSNEEESHSESSQEESENPCPRLLRRAREVAEKTISEGAESTKRCRRSVTSSIVDGPFDSCVIHLGNNCKVSIAGGNRLSPTEACCTTCFRTAYRGKQNENRFVAWKKKASDGNYTSRTENVVKRFLNSQFLPYYMKCQKCGKYDQLSTTESLSAEQFSSYNCPNGCDKMIESSGVSLVRKDNTWFERNTGYPPLLQNNVAFELLSAHYMTKSSGLDATCQDKAKLVHNGGVPFRDTRRIMNMFYVPYTDVIANIVHPEFMEADEKFAFPKFSSEAAALYYLQVRNTIIAMWLKHPFVELTNTMVEAQIIVRGHARIYIIEHLVHPILEFLTIKGVINYGAFDFRINPTTKKVKVAIIGAGISGISAARHLKHLGIDAVLFEAKERYGGRMSDDRSLGVPVGRGAQIIVGNVNNPITLLCEQIGLKYRNSNFFCPLIDEKSGKCYTAEMKELDDQVDLHYNNVLDAIRNKFQSDKTLPDVPLEKMFGVMSQGLLKAADLEYLYTKDFEKLLDFHLGNLEFSCGTKVEKLSSKEYDHNEKFGNFAGEHAVILDGAQSIVDYLSQGLDIQLNSAIKKVNWNEKCPVLHFEDNRPPLSFDKVLITTSLAVLKNNVGLFEPLLPADKRRAIEDLGAGLIEKIAVKFDRRFWSCLDNDGKQTEYFGKVSDIKNDRSLFNIFYDFTGLDKNGKESYVLMSYVTAEHVNLVNTLTDEEVAELFVKTLKKMFPKEKINALGHMVSHWGSDPHIGMSYTYVPYGRSGDATYNKLKETVNDKLYFAGEHTIAAEPQTMTGAYISGLREAGKIVLSLTRGN